MNNLELYFQTHDITYLHEWVSENYKMFYSIVDYTLKTNSLYDMSREDLFQEAVICFYGVVDKFDPNLGAFSTYIYYSISNELMNVLKKQQRSNYSERVRAISIDEPLNDDEKSTFESVASVETTNIMNDILINDMRDYVKNNGNAKLQSVFYLYCQGYKLEEIGKQVGLSKQRVQQILQGFTSQMQEYWGI